MLVLNDDMKTQIRDMRKQERIDLIDKVLEEEDLRYLLIEQSDLKQQLKALDAKINKLKPKLLEFMEATKIDKIELTDGLEVSYQKGSKFYSIAYSKIEAEYPHLLDELEPIIKVIRRKATLRSKITSE